MFRGFRGLIILCLGAMLLGSVSAYAYYKIRHTTPETLLQNPLVQKKVNSLFGEEGEIFSTLLPQFLGFDQPRTYLLLFQNNTEIRPGGGFIGVYAVVRVDKGKVEVVKIEGSERLDEQAPSTWKPVAPKILQEHLGVDRWYFRDSNWSPDFSVSAQKALELFRGENGTLASEIDTVVAFTPTVLERMMELTGPFTVEGINFTAENVVETLEYEVEYNYAKSGRSFADRKGIIQLFFHDLLVHLKENVFFQVDEYSRLVQELTDQKHILVFSEDKALQQTLHEVGWTGTFPEVNSQGDFLLWVDANVAALKTDHVIQKHLTYTIEPQGDEFIARASMTYTHPGTFDWRTTRYRTYARVYVPKGARLIEVNGSMRTDRSTEKGMVDSGEELGRQWFGTFISIEPGVKGTLEFVYAFPPSFKEALESQKYELLVPKQLGVPNAELTISLNFDKNIQTAHPPEKQEHWGDGRYFLETDLILDRAFTVGF